MSGLDLSTTVFQSTYHVLFPFQAQILAYMVVAAPNCDGCQGSSVVFLRTIFRSSIYSASVLLVRLILLLSHLSLISCGYLFRPNKVRSWPYLGYHISNQFARLSGSIRDLQALDGLDGCVQAARHDCRLRS